jgi:DNA-binding CsgD family transcriptional regulator
MFSRSKIAAIELVERSGPLEELRRFLGEAEGTGGRLVLVSGEAGIGKTSLIGHFLQSVARGPEVFAGSCDPLSTPVALGPLLDIARSVHGRLEQLLNDGAPAERCFAELLSQLGRPGRPVVAVIEDVHWADGATLDLLRFLGRRVGSTRALILVTYRDDERTADHPLWVALGDLSSHEAVRRIALRPLSINGVTSLARGRHPDPGELHQRTGGNPFFVTEVLAAGDLAVPATVQAAIAARLARLSPSARWVMQAASVLGADADAGILGAMVGATSEILDECTAKGILRWEADRLVVRHDLTRAAIVASIPVSARADLHRQALRALKSRAHAVDAATLAYHAEEAGDAQATIDYAMAAGDQAAHMGAHREAAEQYRRALHFPAVMTPRQRGSAGESCARECFLTGQIDAAVDAIRLAVAARELAGDALRAADDTALLARLLWNTANRTGAWTAARGAVEQLERLEPGPELAAAYSTMAWLHMQAAQTADAASWARRAIDLASELEVPPVLIQALRTLGAAKLCGPAEDGWPELQRSLELAWGADLPDLAAEAYNTIVWFGSMHRQFGYVDRYLHEALAYCADHDLTMHHHGLLESKCVALMHRGLYNESADLTSGLLAHSTHGLVARVRPLYVLGRIRARQGHSAGAALLDEALAISVPRDELQHIGNVRAARAEAAWLRGDTSRMVAEARGSYQLALASADPWILGELAFWLWRGGALDEVPAVVERHPYGLQILGHWRDAAQAWRTLGCPFEAAGALLDGDEEALREAWQMFDRLQATPAAAAAARMLRRRGVKGVPRGPHQGTREETHGLTPRQAEILELVRQGCTDREIAQRLYLSPKTVSNHVSAILAKLGVRSRREAARLPT